MLAFFGPHACEKYDPILAKNFLSTLTTNKAASM